MALQELNVLYIEDDMQNNKIISYQLEKLFNNVYIAFDGLEGLNLFHEFKIDIIISDINMPNLTGIEFLKEVRKNDKLIPVLFTTAYSEVEYFKESIENNVSSYLIKPIDLHELINKVYDTYLHYVYQKNIIIENNFLKKDIEYFSNIAGIVKLDNQLNITFVNQLILDKTQMEKEVFINQSFHEIDCFIQNKNIFDDIENSVTEKKISILSKNNEHLYNKSQIFYQNNDTNILYVILIFFLSEEEITINKEVRNKLLTFQKDKNKLLNKNNELELKLKDLERKEVNYKKISDNKKISLLNNQIVFFENKLKKQTKKYDDFISQSRKKIQVLESEKNKAIAKNKKNLIHLENYTKQIDRMEILLKENENRLKVKNNDILKLKEELKKAEAQLLTLKRKNWK